MSVTIQEPERVSSFTSTKSVGTTNSTYSRSSVYQTNGKPLSEEAIYKAKLKYGVYNKPGAPSVGVESSASDSAALLATQTDLNIQPYKRNLSSEAATAALIAKTDSAPKAWKRENFAPDAEYAAISAKSIKFPFNSSIAAADDRESSEAASSVLKRDSSTFAREALEDLYAFDDIRNGTHTFTQFDGQSLKSALESSVATSLNSRVNPKLDYRSGLTTKSSAMKMNIGDVHKQSSLNATKSMTLRVAPDRNASRSGLDTSTSLDTSSGAVNISKISSAANESARKSILNRLSSETKDYRTGIPTASDYTSASLASSGAGLSLQKTGFADYAALERQSLRHNTLVDKSIYLIAAANADRTLTMLDNEATTKSLFSNREMNLKALQIAQANLLKRNTNLGKVNLGGGLMMDPKELELLASSIVKPVLTEIDSKAVAQRKSDQVLAKNKLELKLKREQYRVDQKRLKQEALLKKELEKKARKDQLEKEKELEKEKQRELTRKKTGEVKAQEDVLAEKTKEQDSEKETLLSEKLEAEKKIEDEALLKKAERDLELKLLQEEKDLDNAPILEEFEKETTLLDELIAKREAAEKLALEQKERADKAEAELTELNSQLEETNLKISLIKEELATTKEESAKHSSEAELIQKESEAEVQEKLQKEQEFVAKNEKLLAEKSELQAKRAAALVSLQEAKKNALLEELAINSALPEHLQKSVNEDISDESDLDEDQFNTTEEEEEEEEVKKEEEHELQAKDVSTPLKTVVDGDHEPLTAAKIKKSLAANNKTPSKTQKKSTGPVKKTVESPTKKTWKSRVKGFLSAGTAPPVEKKSTLTKPKTVVKEKKVEKKEAPKEKAEPKVEPKEEPKEESKEEPKEEATEEPKNELKQTFSGFSQGSIPDEVEESKKKEVTSDLSPNDDDTSILDEAEKKAEGVFKEDI